MRTPTTNGRRYSTGRDPDPGWALRHSSAMQKNVATALNFSESHLSRMIAGTRPSSTGAFLADVQNLMRHQRTTPGPVIAEVMRAAHTAVRPYETAEIRDLLYHVIREEVIAQAAEDVATYELTRALEDVKGEDATDMDLKRLADAQDAYDEAVRMEIGWAVVGLVVNHELRARRER